MNQRLRIVRVLPFFGADFGGPVAQAHLVQRELVARGHEVMLVSSDLGQAAQVPRDEWHEHEGVQCFFARARGLAKYPPYPAPRTAKRALAMALHGAHIATVNVGLSLWGTALAHAAARAGVPFVSNAEGALDPVRLRQKRLQKQLFLPLFERPMLRAAAAIQAVTQDEADNVLRQVPASARLHVIPNGVALAAAASADSQRDLRQRGRQRLGLDAAAVVVLFFGRVTQLKGVDLLLEAAAPLLRDRREAHLAIVGPDEGAVAQLQRQARALGLTTQVHFHGGVRGPAKAEMLAAADVFALTSRSEGLPNAALEAASAGLPLLVSDECHLPEVTAYDAGRVCTADVAGARAALAELLEDTERRRTCGAGARRMVQEQFAVERVVDRLLDLYTRLARPN